MSEATQPSPDSNNHNHNHEPTETLQLSSIAVAMTVKDLPASLTWYCDIVGFHLSEKFEHEGVVRGASLVAGSAHVMLSQDDGAKGSDRAKGQGMRLWLTTTQDVDEAAAAIKRRGGVLGSDPMDTPWGARVFHLVDPDGFQMTVTSGR